jgi:Skp family chaperone for outer membrane proteins
MKKYILALMVTAFLLSTAYSQTRGVKVGYIDMEYILEKVPDYAEAKSQLEQKAQKWKQEIEVKKIEIAKLKETLKSEKVLLTKELLEEREEEIAFLETELLDFQQKKFGANGDLIVQKTVLVKPIQDQVFNAVQDIAEAQKYDYIFDRSSDLTILFAAKRHDISDRVVRALTRAEKREQMTKKQLKKEEEEERKQDMIDDNPNLTERQRIIDEKKAARLKLVEDRKLAAAEKKQAALDKRKQIADEKEAKKSGTVSDKSNTEPGKSTENVEEPKQEGPTEKQIEAAEKKAAAADAKKKTLEERQKVIDDRKKAAEEKRLKVIADREAAKKAKEEAKNKPK